MKRMLLIGKDGQLGRELALALERHGEVIGTGRDRLDLTNSDSIRDCIRNVKPHVIINAAAYTNVEAAEAQPELARAVNAVASGILAEEAALTGALLVAYSTDYVFDGMKVGPYGEEDAPNPLNLYGRTKLLGEQAIQRSLVPHLIFRISWTFAAQGRNFLLKILSQAGNKSELAVVNDQFGAPTSTRAIAGTTAEVVERLFGGDDVRACAEHSGIYHLSATGQVSWCGFAQAIVYGAMDRGLINRAPVIIPVSSARFATAARRPRNSVLSNAKLQRSFGLRLGSWQESLDDVLEELAHNKRSVA